MEKYHLRKWESKEGVKFEDVAEYKAKMKKKQEELLTEIMQADEDSGLYDS